MPTDASAAGTAKRERLAQRRKALGLTQEQLAGMLDVDRTTVMRWERGGAQPQPWLRPRLARALKVSPERIEALLAGPASAGAGGTALAVPRQLPATVADFTGRGAELRALTNMLGEAGASAPGTVVISAIGGTAGVGKTALALHWAHEVAHRFPDGQLYVNLRGFDPSGSPATPAEAVRRFLDALGVPPGRIPHAPEAQAGLYRSLLADRQMLIVLDNAFGERQVRPLLPASPASLVLVTSRNQLAGLAAADGARMITLDVLTHGEAVQLLAARIGSRRAAAEPNAVAEIATLCAGLPLALAVAAARAATQPAFPLSALAAELRDAAGRLDALDAGDPAASVSAVFSWSYEQLSPEAARLFRLLGLHPGPDISAPAAASLAGTSEPAARRLLRQLARAHLITEHGPGRHAFHDLLRSYAAQIGDRDSENDRTAAVARFLDHYVHAAHVSASILMPGKEPLDLAPPGPGVVRERPRDYRQAMAWFEAEHHVLAAALTQAAGSGFDRHAWQLAWAMASFLATRGHYQQWVAIQRTAVAAAARLGDPAAQAMSTRLLATAYADVGDHAQAIGYYEQSLELYRRTANRLGEAKVYQNLSSSHALAGGPAEALRWAERALHQFRAIGSKAGEAQLLNDVGWLHGILGDCEQARVFSKRAVALCAELGDRPFEARSWDSLGYAEQRLGNLSEAAACYQRALDITRELGERRGEAHVLDHLGDARLIAGDLSRAREAWQQALVIVDDLGVPDADTIRGKLAGLGD